MSKAILMSTYIREHVQDGHMFNFVGTYRGEKVKEFIVYDSSNFDFVEYSDYLLELENVTIKDGTMAGQAIKIKEIPK